MMQHAVVLGACGQVGSMLTTSLIAGGVKITAIDLHQSCALPAAVRFMAADATQLDTQCANAIASADCVVVCLPGRCALVAAQQVLETMTTGALWLDTLSVKQPISTVLRPYLHRIEALSINPMFAPRLGWSDKPVAAIVARGGQRTNYMLGLLSSWGARIECMTSEQHDDLTASIQIATHASILGFGLTLAHLGYDVKAALRLATPPHRVLLALLHRITSMNPEVYWDIQHDHPGAAVVRQSLASSLKALSAVASMETPAGFAELFAKISAILNPRWSDLSEQDARIMSAVLNTPDARFQHGPAPIQI